MSISSQFFGAIKKDGASLQLDNQPIRLQKCQCKISPTDFKTILMPMGNDNGGLQLGLAADRLIR